MHHHALAHLHLALAAAGWPPLPNTLPDLPRAALTAPPELRQALAKMLNTKQPDDSRMWLADAKAKAKELGGATGAVIGAWLDDNAAAVVAYVTRCRERDGDMQAWQGFVTEIAKHHHRAKVTGEEPSEERLIELREKANDTANAWDLPHLALLLSAKLG